MAVDMFLKVEGIEGESQDDSHEKEIDILAWAWNVSQSGSFHMGGGGGSGKANFTDLSVTKWVDASSPDLMLKCSNGAHIDKITLTVRKAGDTPLEYIIVTMEKVMVTSVSTGGSMGEERLTENVTFNSAEIEIKYVPQNEKGAAGAEKIYGWNMAKNVAK